MPGDVRFGSTDLIRFEHVGCAYGSAVVIEDVTFVVTEGWRFGEFFATVGGSVLLWIVAIGGGVVGVGLLVGGLVWRAVARR